jgi:hypothetical protein
MGSRGGKFLVGRLAPGRVPTAPEATLNVKGTARRAVLAPSPAVPPPTEFLLISRVVSQREGVLQIRNRHR